MQQYLKEHNTQREKLFVPYVVWNFIAVGIGFIIDKLTGVDWVSKPSLKQIWESFFSGPLTSLNGASWFVIMLFWVSILYNIIRNVFKDSAINDVILTFAHLIGGFIALYLCVEGFYNKGVYWVFILKIVFYIQFYHYGYMFKKYIEKRLSVVSKLWVCIACIVVNVILTLIYGNRLNFYSTSAMGEFHTWYLPLITSITGIIFYYEVMSFLSEKIGQNWLVDFISRNTFTIMQIHLLFTNIPNFYIYLQILKGSSMYEDFSIESFMNNAWYKYNYNSCFAGFFCGVIGSLLFAYFLEIAKRKVFDLLNRKN